jgi:hypothetical protein
MIFLAETSGIIPCRLMYDGGKNKQVNDIPYSKLLGFISEHIFETLREVSGTFERDNRTMEEIFREYPIEFSFLYKDNKDYNQGISADVSDYQPVEGSGFGSKPSNLNRLFNKQLVIIFKFLKDPVWIDTFQAIWKNRQIFIKGTMDTKKSVVQSLKEISFKFDMSKIYYTLNKFTKAPDDIHNPQKMLFMFNHKNFSQSIYIENLEYYKFSSALDVGDVVSELSFHSTINTIGA